MGVLIIWSEAFNRMCSVASTTTESFTLYVCPDADEARQSVLHCEWFDPDRGLRKIG